MKKLVFLFSFFFFSFGKLISQNADCIDAILLCSTPSFTFFSTQGDGNINELPGTNNISNPATNPNPSNGGCLLQGENSPQWLLISVGNAGTLEFVFGEAGSANPQVGFYDWAMWPYGPNACSDIMNDLLPPIRCNWNGSMTGGTGIASPENLPAGAMQSNFEPALTVNACDQFIICISNFSGVNSLVSFSSFGTASLSCDPSCSSFDICAGNNVTITPINVANLTGTTYSLNPGGLINTTGTFVVSPLTSQTYSSYITGVNSTNAIITTSAIISVVVNPQPTIAPIYTLSTCTNTFAAFDLNLTFNPPIPVPTYTVTWGNTPNGITNNQQTSATNVLTGTYPLTVTAQGGCQTSTVINMAIPAQADFTFIPLGTNSYTINCFQPVMDISTTNSALNYTWTNINIGVVTGTTTPVNSTNLGTWTVTAEHPVSGCVKTHTFHVTQDFTPPTIASISPSLQNITCANPAIQTVTATVTSPTINIIHQFISEAGGTVAITSNPAIFHPGPTNYTYALTNAVNGCVAYKTFSVITAPGFPTLGISSTPTLAGQGNFTVGCNNHSLTVINIVNPNTTPVAGGGLQFGFLSPGSTNTVPAFGSSQSTVISTPGTWTIVALSTNNSCETRIPVTIVQNTVAPNILAEVPIQILNCFIPSVILTAQTTNTAAGYNWLLPGGGNFPNSPTLAVNSTTNLSSTSAGTYILVITDNDNGCISNSVIPMQQNMFAPTPSISVTSKTLTCSTPTMQLSNTSTTKIPPIFPNTNIIQVSLWEGPVPSPTLGLQSSYIASIPGTYTMTIKDLNNGCISFTTLTLQDGRVYPVITPQTYLFDCGAETASISAAMSNTVGMSFLWEGSTSPLTPTFVAGTATAQTAYIYNNIAGVQSVSYNVIVTNTINGCRTRGFAAVLSNGVLNGGFIPDVTNGYAPLTVKFTNNATSSSPASGTQSITSVWNYGNGLINDTSYINTNSNISNGTTIYEKAGTYTVTLYTSKGTCTDVETAVIHVDIPSSLEISNVFTPNGDGVNDIFFLKVANLEEINIVIYDRWGQMVYELVSNTGNIAWDGKTLYGKEAAQGTYFYIINAKGKDKHNFEKKGTITLLR